jgi:hypothetical protein
MKAQPAKNNSANPSAPRRNGAKKNGSALAPDTESGVGASRASVPRELIAVRAYQIFEQEGRPEGRSVENWLRAEAELSAEISTERR